MAGFHPALAAFAGLTVAVAPAMPTWHTAKLAFAYQAMHPQHLHVTLWTVPLGFAGQLVSTSNIVRMLPFMTLIWSCLFWLPALSASGWLVKGGIIAGVWLGFGLLLWYRCLRCDLGGQGRR